MRIVYHFIGGYACLPYDIYDFYLSHNNIINYTYVHRKSWNTGIIPVGEHFIARCWIASWIIIVVDLLAAAQWWLRVIADFCELHYCYCIIACMYNVGQKHCFCDPNDFYTNPDLLQILRNSYYFDLVRVSRNRYTATFSMRRGHVRTYVRTRRADGDRRILQEIGYRA